MRPKGDEDACVVVANRGDVHRRKLGEVDAGRCHRHRDGAAASAEAGAGVLAVLIGRRAVVVDQVGGVPGVIGHMHGGCVAAVLGAMVEARRSQKGGLEPDGPDGGEGAEPHGATHDVQTIHRMGGGPTLRTRTAWNHGHCAVCLGGRAPILGSKSED